MKRFVLGIGLLGLMVPSVASAALALQVGPNSGSTPDKVFTPGSIPTDRQFIDLLFKETGTQENENLTTYDVGLKLVRPAGITGGVNLVDFTPLTEDPDTMLTSPNYVFSRTSTTVIETDKDHILLNFENIARAPNDVVNVTDGMSAGRIFYTVDQNTPAGRYLLQVLPDNTVFANSDALAIPVEISENGIISVVPEPGTLSLLGVAGLLALRRRRAA